MGTPKIEEVTNDQIFVEENKLTRAVKGKKLRRDLAKYGVKLDMKVESTKTLLLNNYLSENQQLQITVHYPANGSRQMVSQLANQVAGVVLYRYAKIGSSVITYKQEEAKEEVR